LAFSLLVIIHELGHFTLAKLNGVKVEEFSLGMGPKLFGMQGKETLYSIRALPIGGYVKMLGEEGDSVDERAFSNKSPLRRLSIAAAGPLMNIILAIVLFSIVSSLRGYLVPIISDVVKESPAMEAGIKPGDKIVQINNTQIATWDDLVTQIAMSKGSPLNVTLIRNNEKTSMNLIPMLDNKSNTYMIGVAPTLVSSPPILQSIKYGFKQTSSTIKQTFLSLRMLFTGKAKKEDVGGPVTIMRVTYAVSQAGLINLIAFSAFISIQLAIFNLLPFPALDGFLITVSLYQVITRKEINKDKIGVINTIGFALLLLLMILVTIKDVLYPIKL
jgi:regulator of sigma E protease